MKAFLGKLPRQVGGTEAPLSAQFDEIEAMSYGDGSLGWNHTFMASCAGIAAARLPDGGVAEIMATSTDGSWPAFCGTLPPSGRFVRTAGGFRVSGRWGFASGIRDAAWIVCGASGADGALKWFALPVGEAVVHDTWDSPGLAGTNSCDYSLDDVFVPEQRSFSFGDAPRRGGALFELPMHAYLTPDHTGVTLGCARRALDECASDAVGNQRLGSTEALDRRGAFVGALGRSHTQLSAARTLVRDVLARIDDADGGVVDATLLLDARCAATHAAEVAVDVATFAYRSGGARAVRGSSALGRAWRDTMTSTQHVHVLDDVYEWRGAELLG
jgi:indole-3-acetate monooxygenase